MEILTELTNNILVITLNRPEAGNSLNGALSEGLSNALTDAATNPEVRAIVITGAGEKIFCAGMDLKAWTPASVKSTVIYIKISQQAKNQKKRKKERLKHYPKRTHESSNQASTTNQPLNTHQHAIKIMSFMPYKFGTS
jgi:enoyl-CoA hydratase/carnithine racemase